MAQPLLLNLFIDMDNVESSLELKKFHQAVQYLKDHNIFLAFNVFNFKKQEPSDRPMYKYFVNNVHKFNLALGTTEKIIDFLKGQMFVVTSACLSLVELGNDANEGMPTFGPYPGSDDVYIITDDNFRELIVSHRRWLILFHASWNHRSQDIKYAFAAAARQLRLQRISCQLAAVDASEENFNTAARFNITVLPSFKYVEGYKFLRRCPRRLQTCNDIVKFVRSKCMEYENWPLV